MTIEDLRLGSMTLKQLNRDYTPEFREKQKLVRNMGSPGRCNQVLRDLGSLRDLCRYDLGDPT